MAMTLQQQISAMNKRLDAMESAAREAAKTRSESDEVLKSVAKKVDKMADVFFEPQPGHDKNLVQRFADITVDIESGQRTATNILGGVKWLSGLIIACGIIYAAWKLDR